MEIWEKPEWRFLELLSVSEPHDERFAQAVELAAELRDFPFLIYQAAAQRVTPLVARFDRVRGLSGELPETVLVSLWDQWNANRIRVAEHVDEALQLADGFRGGEQVVFTKGVVCQQRLYGEPGLRQMADIDLMTEPHNREFVRSALLQLGYAERKVYSRKSGALEARPRSELLNYAISPDHLPHFLRLNAAKGGLLPAFVVDVALSFTWYRAAWQPPVGDMMNAAVDVAVVGAERCGPLPTLSSVQEFIFLALHFFREAWFIGDPVQLSQVADIARSWERLGTSERVTLCTYIAELQVQPPIGWVAAHVDEIFRTSIVDALELSNFASREWITSVATTGGVIRQWHGDMRRRLVESGVCTLLEVPDHIPFADSAGM